MKPRQFTMESSSQNNASEKTDCTLVIMAKAPQPGMVKTRLVQYLSASTVTELYRCLLEDTLKLAQSLAGVEVVIMCPSPDASALAPLAGNGIRVVPQRGEGLAAGLTSAFAQFAAPGQRRVIAFNSDSPHLPASVLETAFDALATCDVVVGPTEDGGYYLIGARTSYPTLFEKDGLGTRNALEGLLDRTRALRLSTGFTEPFYDIDKAEDLIRLAQELQLAPERAPRTAAWLAQWRQVVAQLKPAIGEPCGLRHPAGST